MGTGRPGVARVAIDGRLHVATAGACVFCGSAGGLTREHVFGDWLTGLGLDPAPVAHTAGPLNRIGRELGVRSPFRQTVRKVCGACNNGWMSRLEVVAKRVLTPFILGQPGEIDAADAGVVTAWVQKTALTAMLVLSEDERANGQGLPTRGVPAALPAARSAAAASSQRLLAIARYAGQRGFLVWVTPLAVHIAGLPEPDRPQGYAITVVLGQLLLHGLRFTAPSLQMEVSTPTPNGAVVARGRAGLLAGRHGDRRWRVPRRRQRQGAALSRARHRSPAVDASDRAACLKARQWHGRAADDLP